MVRALVDSHAAHAMFEALLPVSGSRLLDVGLGEPRIGQVERLGPVTPRSAVIELEMSVEDALKMVVSLGVVVPKWHPIHPESKLARSKASP